MSQRKSVTPSPPRVTTPPPVATHPSEGDGEEEQPEFTFRAVAVGLLIGVLLCFTNTYFGLQSGWISMMSLQASLLGFAVFKVLPQSSLFNKRPLSVHENVDVSRTLRGTVLLPSLQYLTASVLQTTAVATGTLPLAAGLVGVIPALSQLSLDLDGSPPLILSFPSLLAWCFAVAFFGVFLAVPLRRQVIVKEKLVFPSGTATAQIISVLHGVQGPLRDEGGKSSTRRRREGEYRALATDDGGLEGQEVEEGDEGDSKETKIDRSGWMALTWSFVISASYTLLSIAFPVIYAIPIFNIFGNLAHDWLWWFTPSFSYIGQGIIMGAPTTLSMNAGMLVGWAFLSPLAKHSGWAPGPVASSVDGARGWILWPALAVMTAESVLSVSLVAVHTFFPPSKRHTGHDEDDETEEVEPVEKEANVRVVIGGVVLSCVSCVVLVAMVFGEDGIKWWATCIALVLASLFSILGVRALGETDLNPVSAIGKISQLLFAIVQPHNIVANLIAGGISEAGAQQAGDLMQDLKTGHLHGASPRAQFYGQVIGSLASVFVSSGIYVLYRRVYELPSASFPVPTAAIWLNLARLVNSGKLPPRSKETMIIFGAAFVLLAGIKLVAASRPNHQNLRWTKFIPSGIAFAIGFINTPSFSIARLIGGLISLYVSRRTQSTTGSSSGTSHLQNISLIIVASGFVLGEGLASVVGLIVKSVGGGPVSCWGCNIGGGGYCGGC